MLALMFFVRRIQPFISLVYREVEFLRTNDLIVLHLQYILFIYCGKKIIPGTHVQTRQKVTGQMSYRGKKMEKNNNRKEKKKKKKKHLTVVDPETLFMRNSKLIYCPKTCIA